MLDSYCPVGVSTATAADNNDDVVSIYKLSQYDISVVLVYIYIEYICNSVLQK